jgi:hypothetical protein
LQRVANDVSMYQLIQHPEPKKQRPPGIGVQAEVS